MPKKSDWLLQFVGDDPIDPIRIQKGMFLFAKEAGAPKTQVYDFVPYNWGPCSFEIYGDLDDLLARGLIERAPVLGASWSKYQRTATGHVMAKRTARSGKIVRDLANRAAEIRATVQGKDFEKLLRSVYQKYPEYATKSLLRG